MTIFSDFICCAKKSLLYSEPLTNLNQLDKNTDLDLIDEFSRPSRNIELPPVPKNGSIDKETFNPPNLPQKKNDNNYYATVPLSSIYYCSLKKGSSRSSISKNIYKTPVRAAKSSDQNSIDYYNGYSIKNDIVDSNTLSSDAYSWINNRRTHVDNQNPLKYIRRLMKKAIKHHIKTVDNMNNSSKEEKAGSGQYRQVAVRESIPSLKARNAYPNALYSEPLMGIPVEINENSLNTLNSTNNNDSTMNGYQNTNEYDRVYCYSPTLVNLSADGNQDLLYNGIETNESSNGVHSFNRRLNSVAPYAVSTTIVSLNTISSNKRVPVNDSDAYTEIPEETTAKNSQTAIRGYAPSTSFNTHVQTDDVPIYAVSTNHSSLRNKKSPLLINNTPTIPSLSVHLDEGQTNRKVNLDSSNSLHVIRKKFNDLAFRLKKRSFNIKSAVFIETPSPCNNNPHDFEDDNNNVNQDIADSCINKMSQITDDHESNMMKASITGSQIYTKIDDVVKRTSNCFLFEDISTFRHMDSEDINNYDSVKNRKSQKIEWPIDVSQQDSVKISNSPLVDEDEYAVTSHVDSNQGEPYGREAPDDEYEGVLFPQEKENSPVTVSAYFPTQMPHSSTYDDLIYSQA